LHYKKLKLTVPVWLKVITLDVLHYLYNGNIKELTIFVNRAFNMMMHEQLMYKWIKRENNIRSTARFNPNGV